MGLCCGCPLDCYIEVRNERNVLLYHLRWIALAKYSSNRIPFIRFTKSTLCVLYLRSIALKHFFLNWVCQSETWTKNRSLFSCPTPATPFAVYHGLPDIGRLVKKLEQNHRPTYHIVYGMCGSVIGVLEIRGSRGDVRIVTYVRGHTTNLWKWE